MEWEEMDGRRWIGKSFGAARYGHPRYVLPTGRRKGRAANLLPKDFTSHPRFVSFSMMLSVRFHICCLLLSVTAVCASSGAKDEFPFRRPAPHIRHHAETEAHLFCCRASLWGGTKPHTTAPRQRHSKRSARVLSSVLGYSKAASFC